ncbi:unnamed protein product [Prunus armeniaca]
MKYVLNLLTDIGMLDCKPADTLIVQNHHLSEYPDQVPTNKERYQRLVGRLIYLSRTRPDIAYASAHGKGLMFSKHGHLNIDGYSDADWAGSVTDRKSTSGYFTFAHSWEAAIAVAQNPVQHDRTKYVEVDQHFIKQKLEAKVLQFLFVKSEDQLADILTKCGVACKLLKDEMIRRVVAKTFEDEVPRAKFPTALKTINWSTSQLSLVYERATASNEDSSKFIL